MRNQRQRAVVLKTVAGALMASLLGSASAQADVVSLRNGSTFRGIVTADTDSTVSVQSDGSVWTFPRDQVASVEMEAKGRSAEKESSVRNAVPRSSRHESTRTGLAQRESGSQVIVYGTSWCGYCRRAREYFASRRVPFVDRDVEKDSQAREEVARKCLATGIPFRGGVPVLDVYGQILRGFSVPSIESALRRHQAD
jgi:glutaredoxin